MMAKGVPFRDGAFDLLKQLEHILEVDTLIDEVGFLHPSQFVALNEDRDGSLQTPIESSSHFTDEISGDNNLLDSNTLPYDSSIFWNREHKLAISSEALFSLYIAARHAFMTALNRYRMSLNLPRKEYSSVCEVVADNCSVAVEFLEREIMMHSKALLLLSCDFNTAWNSRKLVLSRSLELNDLLVLDELKFSALVLAYSPKSEHAWSHRRWVIRSIAGKHSNLQKILERESELVEKIAEKSKMNYRAWNHRCWLVAYMTRVQVLDEFNNSRKWAELHVADNCCFHYRQQQMLKILESGCLKQDIFLVWKEELDWNAKLLKLYIGREALWIHRRFLSLCWIKHLASDIQGASHNTEHQCCENRGMNAYVEDELQLVRSCLNIPNNEFEDGQTQAVLAASYILWVLKQVPELRVNDPENKLVKELGHLKNILIKSCPEKRLDWDSLLV
ncbi:hypothetical protein Sjap_023027 [Stephania japonica]|uniref:Uncharacterized protein n=1 Tax=Stephania japonica TaxID=461633 RepID=A0AAP0HVG2_9MAGN